MDKIDNSFVNSLYNPEETGIKVLKGNINSEKLKSINEYVRTKQDSFEVKREKYIANNQLVSLLYRGPFDTSALDDTVFGEILNDYKRIREEIQQYSDLPFEQGSSIEVKLIHYPLSDLGVGIHKDLSSNINVVIFFNLEGSTVLNTYADKQGNGLIGHDLDTGDISIMRAPRNKQEPDIRPYHGVEKVAIPRTVLVVREINEELEKETNKDNWRGF